MTTEIKIAPQNSLLFVMDKNSGQIPESMNGKPVAATRSCIAVGTLSAADGETSVILTDDQTQVTKNFAARKVFSGILETPNKTLDICTVLLDAVLMMSVPTAESHVEIWSNHETEPDWLCVVAIK